MADFKRLFSDRTWRVIALAALGFSTLALFMAVGSDTTKCAFAAAGTCPAGDTRTFARGLEINTDVADSDTIISGDTVTNLLFADASTDRIGIGTSTPATLLHVAGALTVDGTLTLTTALAVASGGTGATTAAGARTNLGVTATGADTTYAFRANDLSDLASTSTARTNLGLGTMATQAASNVAITGGSIGPFTLTGLLSGNNQSITGVNNLTATSSTLGTLAVTSIGAHSLTGAIAAGNQSITGVNNLTATSSTLGTLAVTSIGAHSLTGALTAGNQSITGVNNLTATSSTIGTVTITAGMSATGQYYAVQATTTVTLDWNSGNVQYIQLASGGNTFTFANPQAGARYLLILKQPSGGATSTAAWPADVLWPSGTAPTLTPTLNKVDVVAFVYDGTNAKYYGGGTLNY